MIHHQISCWHPIAWLLDHTLTRVTSVGAGEAAAAYWRCRLAAARAAHAPPSLPAPAQPCSASCDRQHSATSARAAAGVLRQRCTRSSPFFQPQPHCEPLTDMTRRRRPVCALPRGTMMPADPHPAEPPSSTLLLAAPSNSNAASGSGSLTAPLGGSTAWIGGGTAAATAAGSSRSLLCRPSMWRGARSRGASSTRCAG